MARVHGLRDRAQRPIKPGVSLDAQLDPVAVIALLDVVLRPAGLGETLRDGDLDGATHGLILRNLDLAQCQLVAVGHAQAASAVGLPAVRVGGRALHVWRRLVEAVGGKGAQFVLREQRAEERPVEETDAEVGQASGQQGGGEFHAASREWCRRVRELACEVLGLRRLGLELDRRLGQARIRAAHDHLAHISQIGLALDLQAGVGLVGRSLELILAGLVDLQLVDVDSTHAERGGELPRELRGRGAVLVAEEVHLRGQHRASPRGFLLGLEDVAADLVIVRQDLVGDLGDVIELHGAHPGQEKRDARKHRRERAGGCVGHSKVREDLS
mmetsp:Transcript_78321/g.239555  ORF Transcript_78321/g.239555 Transcript_78321/m.239555 type:complete len:328 (-) Transcript_78321:2-985(-)